jgi:hypothetical protein
MSQPFDATLKELLAQAPGDWQKAFHLPVLQPATALNADVSTITAATDVAIGYGDPLQEIVDVNFQSGPDPNVAARLHLYSAAFHLRFPVPIRSILILLRPKAIVKGLTGKLSYTSGGKRVLFEYDVIRMWKEPVERFLEGGVGLLPLAPLCKKSEGVSWREVIHEIDRRLAQLPDQAQAVRLMTATWNLAALRIPNKKIAGLFEGVTVMHKLPAWDEAELRGSLATSQKYILKLGRERFGDPAPKTENALTAINDLDRLERMFDAISTVKSWKALLAVK